MDKPAAETDDRAHWQDVYTHRDPAQASWYEPLPATSLAWITDTGVALDAAILDAGGGTSSLAGELVARGYTDVTVADISPAALEHAEAHSGEATQRITWLHADLRSHAFDRSYDLWHDRAAFHFMVNEHDRDRYLTTLTAAIRPGGHLILATFGPDGPTKCSNLPVRRYSANEIAVLLADDFDLRDAQLSDHRTPSGAVQRFLYARLRRHGEAARD